MPRNTAFVLGAAVLAALAAKWYLYAATDPLRPPMPTSASPTRTPSPTTPSTLSIPVSVPIDTLDSHLESLIPHSFADSSTDEILDELDLSASARWNLRRSALGLSARDTALHAHLGFSGPVDLAVDLGPVGVNATVELRGRLLLSTQPQLQSDWRLTVPDLTLRAEYDEATVPVTIPITRHISVDFIERIPIVEDLPLIGELVSGFREVVRTVTEPIEELTTVDVSVRGIVRDHMEPRIESLRRDIIDDVAAAPFLREAAATSWQRLCSTVALGSGVWLQSKPVRAHAAQPRITDDAVLLQLGIDVHSRLLPEDREPTCPFPETLTLRSPSPGRIEINLPAEIRYAILDDALTEFLVGQSYGDGVLVSVHDITHVGASGGSLVLGIAVTVDTREWLRARAKGTVYILATPHLDLDSQTIRFLDVSMDAESRNHLVHAVGEIGEPLLERAIERYTFELEPLRQRLLRQGNDWIASLAMDEFTVSGEIQDIRLTRLEAGAETLRLQGTTTATASVEIP